MDTRFVSRGTIDWPIQRVESSIGQSESNRESNIYHLY